MTVNLVKGFKEPFRCRQAAWVTGLTGLQSLAFMQALFNSIPFLSEKLCIVSLSSKMQSYFASMTTVISLTSFLLSQLALLRGCKTSLLVFKFHTSQIAKAISTGMKFTLQDSLISIQNGCILTLDFPRSHSKSFRIPFIVTWYSLYPKLKTWGLCWK